MSERCVITLPLKTQPWQEDVINKRLEISRNIYNAMLGYENKKLKKLKQNPEYVEAVNTLYECAKNDKKNHQNIKMQVKSVQHYLKNMVLLNLVLLQTLSIFQNIIVKILELPVPVFPSEKQCG